MNTKNLFALALGVVIILCVVAVAVAADVTSNHSVTWNTATTSPGPHQITAVAYDAAGNASTPDTITVWVNGTGTASSSLTLTSTVSDVMINYKSSTIFRAKMTDAKTSREVTNSAIYLWRKYNNTWTYTGLRAYYNSTSGFYERSFWPTGTADYQVRYYGNTYYQPKTSASVRVRVWSEVK